MSTSIVTWLDPDLAARLSNVRDDADHAPRCSIPGCSGAVRCRGWCKSHYDRYLRSGDPQWEPTPKPVTCLLPGCHRPTKALGLCWKDYWRAREGVGPTAAKCC